MTKLDQATQLAAELENDILSGKFGPGDELPSERDLSADRGVSRNVVREALGRLASLGLVQRLHGSGTRVQRPSGRDVVVSYQRLLRRADLRLADLAAVRQPLETRIAALAAEKRTNADLEALAATQKILGDPSRPLDEHVKADMDFHALLAAATANPFFQIVLEPMQQLLIESRRRTLGMFGAGLAFGHHARIYAAVEAADPIEAEAGMKAHLDINYEHLQTVGESDEGEPAEKNHQP